MASVVYITEFCNIGFPGGSSAQNAAWPKNASQTVAAGASSTQSSAFQNNTQLIRVNNDGGGAICFDIGTNPTAVAGGTSHMPANGTEYFTIPLGQAFKIAVIANAT